MRRNKQAAAALAKVDAGIDAVTAAVSEAMRGGGLELVLVGVVSAPAGPGQAGAERRFRMTLAVGKPAPKKPAASKPAPRKRGARR